MTKSQLQTLKQAATVLEALEPDSQNKNFNIAYRGAIGTAQDEIGMIILCAEQHPEVFSHRFLNDDLAKHVSEGQYSKDAIYQAIIGGEENNEFYLELISEKVREADGYYQTYLTKQEAQEDVYELERLGYKIV